MLQTARRLHIHLFGRPHLTDDQAPLKFKAPARALSLLAYLLVHGTAPLTRDAVAFALWPDDIETDARANVRRHLFYLTNDVLPPAAPKTPWILADKRTIAWNAAADASCDVRDFERLSAEAESVSEAVALYRGDLLEGFEDEWIATPRERFRERQIDLLLGLIATSRANATHAAGMAYARQVLAIDPWREDALRALIEFRDAAGDRAGALATYRDFVKRLEAEMGVAPMPATTAQYERVAAASTPLVVPSLVSETAADPAPDAGVAQSVGNADALRTVPSFTGRENELERVEFALWSGSGFAAIHGLGGVGKSSLAREYARRNRDRYAAVWWLNAETDAGIVDGLVRLGATLVPALAKRDDRRSVAEHVASNILGGLSKPVLLVFDNLEDERLLRSWSPPAPTHVLVTSRQAGIGAAGATIRLETWQPDETIRYLRHAIGRADIGDADALRLAQTLGFLPLALAHAAAYLRSSVNVTADRYLERVGDHLARAPRGADYDRAVFATFHAAIARAEEFAPGAAALLCLAAWYGSDAIPEELFAQSADVYASTTPELPGAERAALDLRSAVADGMGIEDALGALDRFSLLTFTLRTRTYTIHRLVQKAARSLAESSAAPWAQSSVAAADAVFPQDDFANWPRCERLLPHAQAALAAFHNDWALPSAARLALRSGRYLCKRAAFPDAEILLRQSLALAEVCTANGVYDRIADHLTELAALLRDTNRLAQAEPLHRRAIDILERDLGRDHPDVAAALNDFAILLQYSSRVGEAEALYRRALAIDETHRGAEHPVVALRLHNLALVLHETNRRTEAESLLERALGIDEKVSGGDHPDVARDLGSLGWLTFETGRIALAERRLRRAAAIREATYGDEHPLFAHALSDVAVLLHDSGHSTESESLHRQAQRIYEANYGVDHPVVAACLNALAEVFTADGRFDAADEQYRCALAIDERAFGPTHPNVARDLNNFAGLLVARGRPAEAEPLLQRARTIATGAYAPDHPRIQSLEANAALLKQLIATGPKAVKNTATAWRTIRRSPSRGLR